MFSVLFALMMSTAHAGFIDRCIDLLSADDPWPNAEVSAEVLFHSWLMKRDGLALKELVFRLRAGMLNPEEVQRFWAIANEGDGDEEG